MLTLICGVGRAGKTTYSQRFDNVIHLDEMGVTPERYRNVLNAIKDRTDDIVIEGIYKRSTQRKDLVNAYKGATKCIWLHTPEHIVRQRMYESGYPITPHHMTFEAPDYSEGWDEIIEIQDDGNDS